MSEAEEPTQETEELAPSLRSALKGAVTEEAAPDVGARQRSRILLHQHSSQADEATRVVVVPVGQDDVGNAGQIQCELLRVFEHCIGLRTRVEQDPATVRLDQCPEPPFANEVIREHGGEDHDACFLYRRGGFRSGLRLDRLEHLTTDQAPVSLPAP